MGTDVRWLRIGASAAFAAAVTTLAAAVAGGITEPTGVATLVAVIAATLAYGVAPLVVTVALRQGALSSWWAVAAAVVAAVLWVILLLAPLLVAAPDLVTAILSSAPSASALWIVAASFELIRAGMHRWSLVGIAGFVAVLIIGSVFIELSGFDIRKVLVPLGWAGWMVDLGSALRARMSPRTPGVAAVSQERCANCGAPRRQDGLAFCGECGLPYGVTKNAE